MPRLDNLIAEGKVHEILAKPVSGFSVRDVLARILAGNPMGKDLLKSKSRMGDTLPSFAGAKILVADDSAVNREVVIQALGRFEVEPLVVECGMDAIKAYDSEEFDFVFLDCSMPDIDGYSVAVEMRRIEASQDRQPVPVIALTAHIADQIREKVKQASMNDILSKPFTIKSMGACLERWLGDKRADFASQDTLDGIPEPQPADDDAIFDESLLADLKEIAGEGFDNTVRQLRSLYLESAPLAYQSLKEAVSERDLATVETAAHALKSMSFNIAAGRLGTACQVMESAAMSLDANSVQEAFAVVRENFQKVMEQLEIDQAADTEDLVETGAA